ncbi:MAG: hypothetical protein WC058_16440, partial [Phycisphaeraceae bacterium]
QAMLYATGLTPDDMGKPQVGICSVWYEGNPCNMHLASLGDVVKRGVVASGAPKRGGRNRLIDLCPQVEIHFLEVLAEHTTGDPMREQVKWTDLTRREISQRLAAPGGAGRPPANGSSGNCSGNTGT